MKEPILSREEAFKLARCFEGTENVDNIPAVVALTPIELEQFVSAVLEKLCGEPAAWITWQSKDGKQKLEYGCIATNPEYCKAHDEWIWTPLYTLKDRQS